MQKIFDALFEGYMKMIAVAFFVFMACLLILLGYVAISHYSSLTVPSVVFIPYGCVFVISLAILALHAIGGTIINLVADIHFWFSKHAK